MTNTDLPDAEVTLSRLADKMRGAIAYDANLIGIYSGGAWLAERLAQMLDGEHRVGYIDVSFYRDDYAQKGLRARPETTALPFEVAASRIVLVDSGAQVRRLSLRPLEPGDPTPVASQLLFWAGIDFNLWNDSTRIVRGDLPLFTSQTFSD